MSALGRLPDARLCMALALLLLAAALALRALAVGPVKEPAATTELAHGVPRDFGVWQALDDGVAQVSASTTEPGSPYTDQLLRSYRDRDGHIVMLTLAYVARQTPYTRPHAPEACYAAAGFDILSLQPVRLSALEAEGMDGPLMARRMLAQRGARREAVTYWLRIGGLYGPGSLASRWELLQDRLRGDTTDGILVRASTLLAGNAQGDSEPAAAHALLERFLADLLAATPPATRLRLKRP